MYSPKTFVNLFLPALQRVSEICHKHGGAHLFASDGNIWPVADVLFGQAGIDGYYEIDRRAGMDLESLREQFPALVLLGNISSHTVHLGSKQMDSQFDLSQPVWRGTGTVLYPFFTQPLRHDHGSAIRSVIQ